MHKNLNTLHIERSDNMLTGKYSSDSSDYNNGVTCTVSDCQHYEAGNHCAIQNINVDAACTNCNTSENTMCQSFKPKNTKK